MSKYVKHTNTRIRMERKKSNLVFSLILLFMVGICWFCAFFPSVKIIEPTETGPDYFHYHESFD